MIYGDQVGLRPVEEEDLPLLAQWRNNPQTRILFFTPFMLSVSGQKKWYQALLNAPTRVQFMVVRLEDSATIGTVGLDHINYRNQDAEIGCMVLDPSVRGHELGPDAGRALMRYAFRDLNLHRLYARLYAFNRRVLRASEKIGFKQEGIARKAAFVNGEFHDVIFSAVLREEWQEEQYRYLVSAVIQDKQGNAMLIEPNPLASPLPSEVH